MHEREPRAASVDEAVRSAPEQAPILEVDGLAVRFGSSEVAPAVRDISWSVARGETLAIVGESGSGKSVSALTVLDLLPANASVVGGSVRWRGVTLQARERRALRGGQVSMIFQDPRAALSPLMTIEQQVGEVLRMKGRIARSAVRARVLELLTMVGLSSPERRLRQMAYELSGGMAQRVMIALALAADPEVLIADEPTSALDVTIQAQILTLLNELQERTGVAIVLITHDLGVVAQTSDRVVVVQRGEVEETGPVEEILLQPRHPYTVSLLSASLRVDEPRRDLGRPGHAPTDGAPSTGRVARRSQAVVNATGQRVVRGDRDRPPPTTGTSPVGRPASGDDPLLQMTDLDVSYSVRSSRSFRREKLRAVQGLTMEVGAGEVVGLVGESGSGKSTVAAAITRLCPVDAGRIEFQGQDVTSLTGPGLHRFRRDVQMVFQDPYSSLNPHMSIEEIVAEPLLVHRIERPGEDLRRRVVELLDVVGLDGSFGPRLPRSLSGGQRQRVSIARALALEPKLLVADEIVSALDVSVQAQVLGLLQTLQARLGLASIFITHDLAVVRHVADRIGVMYAGRLVEFGPVDEVCSAPKHPYTAALLDAVPLPDPRPERRLRAPQLADDALEVFGEASRCPYQPRCPRAEHRCSQEFPARLQVRPAHSAACFFPGSSNDRDPSGPAHPHADEIHGRPTGPADPRG